MNPFQIGESGERRGHAFTSANRFAFIMMGVMVAGSAAIALLMKTLDTDSVALQYILFYGLQFTIPLVIYLQILGRRDPGRKPAQVLRLKMPRSKYTFVLAALFAVLIQPSMMVISALSSLFFHNYLEDAMVNYLSQPMWVTLILMAVLPAVFEESLCRGLYLNGCREVRTFAAAVLGGLFFGMLHMNPQQAIYAAIFGFFCTMLAIGSDSIFPSMLVHFLINGIQMVLAYVTPAEEATAEVSRAEVLSAALQSLPIALLTLGVSLWCMIRIFRVNGRDYLLRGGTENGRTPLSLREMLPGLAFFAGCILVFAGLCLLV
ncbi:MAG: CPBP family intramembrane metalloprotease [Firmicutes bacterium]|nr:CPBP family intramembrane metalloprotease [Bacillota bacterium]